MDPEETIEGSPSEATPLEAPEQAPAEAAPSETPAPEEAPAEAPADTTPAPEPELFELPDGRKVDAATLSTLWKEEFYPDYTKKSQDLAAIRNGQQQPPAETKIDPLQDPNYIPPTYGDLAAQIETRILTGLSERAAAEQAARQAIEDTAISQLAEVKATDPNVNEGQLFQHAMKYGFTDLRTAHANMRDTAEAVKKAMTLTKDNAAGRVDPVSSRPGATGAPLNPDAFASSVDYMRALKAQGKV